MGRWLLHMSLSICLYVLGVLTEEVVLSRRAASVGLKRWWQAELMRHSEGRLIQSRVPPEADCHANPPHPLPEQLHLQQQT